MAKAEVRKIGEIVRLTTLKSVFWGDGFRFEGGVEGKAGKMAALRLPLK